MPPLNRRDVVAEAQRYLAQHSGGAALTIEKSDADAAAPLRFRLFTAAELAEIPDPEPLVRGVLDRATLAMMVAKYDSYKSFVAMDLGLCVCHGLDWHGHDTTRGLVIYIYAEGQRSIRRRVEAWRLLNGMPDVGGIYFLPQSVLLNDAQDLSDLLRTIAAVGEQVVLIIVDTVARTFKGNENAAEDMGAYIVACDRLKETTGATVLLVHHTGWGDQARSRGSISLPSAADTELTLERDGERVTVKATKQKDSPEGDIVTLEAVPIASSLALKRFGPMTPALSKNERKALESVQDEEGLSSTNWQKASGLAHGSFQNARSRLVSLCYVRLDRRVYVITESGRAAIRPTVQASTNAVQSTAVPVSPTLPLSIRQGSGLDDDVEAA